MSRNFVGESTSVTFSNTSKVPICKISTNMNFEKYIDILEDCLIPFIEKYHDDNGIFARF